jgi:SagB-type dehydrogenase family enzyme
MEKTWYQKFIGKSAVVFVWAAIPYKTEWRYSFISYKDILIEAGHICQNLYLACEAIGAGTCAIAAYEQKAIDELIQVDGENEMTVYLSPVGKINRK